MRKRVSHITTEEKEDDLIKEKIWNGRESRNLTNCNVYKKAASHLSAPTSTKRASSNS